MSPSLLGTVGRAAPFRLLNRAGAAALPLLLAAWFGRSAATDLYALLAALFTLAGSLIFACFQDSALIPLVMDLERRDRDQLARFVGSLIGLTALGSAALAAIIGVAALGWFHTRVAADAAPVLVPLVLGFALYLPALALRSLGSGLLAARFLFVTDAIGGAAGMAATLGLAALLHGRGLAVLPVALAAGETVAAVIVFAALHRAGMPISLRWGRTAAVSRLLSLVSSQIGGAALVRVNPLCDQVMAQALGVLGGGTLLRLSNDLASAGTSLLGPLFLSVLLSHLSFAGADGQHGRFRRTVRRSLAAVLVTLTLLALAMHVLRGPLVAAVYGRGAMDRAGVETIAGLLPYHLLGVPALGALMVLARAHVSLGNTRLLGAMGALNAGLNALLNLVLARALGLPGIALGTSLVHIAVAVVFWARLGDARRRFARAQVQP